MSSDKPRVAVLISGRGSNMQAIIEDAKQDDCPYQVSLVLSNRADAKGLAIAQAAKIATQVIDHKNFPDRLSFDQQVQATLLDAQIDLVTLAGFMRILSAEFVAAFAGRMINVHPSLLPDFKGLDTHQRVLDAGVSEHGASVHFVTAALDAGPVILQARVPVKPDDDAESLAARVLKEEHRMYPQALRLLAQGRLALRGNQAYLDGQPTQF